MADAGNPMASEREPTTNFAALERIRRSQQIGEAGIDKSPSETATPPSSTPPERIEDTASFSESAVAWRARRRPERRQSLAQVEPVPPLESSSAAIYAGITPSPRAFVDGAS